MKQGRDLTSGSLLFNLIAMAVPIMFSNFIQVFYNLTDTFFLGQMEKGSTQAVAVTGLAFPMIFLFISLGQGLAVATTALVSRYKGRGDIERIKHILGQTWLLSALFLSFLGLMVAFGIMPMLRLIDTPAEILDRAFDYTRLILSGIMMLFVFFNYQSFAIAMGDTISPMAINCISLLINVVLDPILIYGLGGFPEMGVRGAGLATLLARTLTVVMASIYMYKRYRTFIPGLADFKPVFGSIRLVLKVAIPSSMAQTTTSLGFVVMQGLVNSFGTTVMSAHAIGHRFVSFIMMPPMGISNALAGIVGQNLGAGQPDRARKSFYVAMGLSTTIMTIGTFFLYFKGNLVSSFFISDPEAVKLINEMLKINSIALWFFGFLFMFWGVFNGSGHTRPVMFADILRLWLIRLPLAYLLSGYFCSRDGNLPLIVQQFFNSAASILADKPYTALWWPMIVSNVSASIFALIIYRKGDWVELKE
ncbi:MAG: MATE family efflux transporter [Candidatus Rifleibacteriota bacterium]